MEILLSKVAGGVLAPAEESVNCERRRRARGSRSCLGRARPGLTQPLALHYIALMETCPVCDTPHAHGALECATCGRVFFAAADLAVAAARLPELETTQLAAPGLAVPAEVVPGLEVTSFSDISARAAPPGDAVAGLETTGLSTPVGAVAVELDPDLERTVAEPVGEPSGWEVACPNCGAVGQARGLYCDKCGTRLQRPADGEDLPMASGVALDDDGPKMCKACGAMRIRNGLCMDCGAPVRA